MKEVMQKAQELADAIINSDVYKSMKTAEETVQEDEEASRAVSEMISRRKKVEDLLTGKNMDPEELKKANLEMLQAEHAMNRLDKVAELKKKRRDFSDMMDNVNRVLRLVITGEIREDDFSATGRCSGDCSGCSGCN